MLRRKLLRDLWRQRAQVAAVVVIVFLGTALFISSYLAYQNLSQSYRDVQIRTGVADMIVDAAAVTTSHVRQVGRLAGVAEAESQLIIDLPAIVAEGTDREGRRGEVKPEVRLISLPLRVQPHLNQVVILEGRYPRYPSEVLVERHFADYHELRPGDEVRVDTGDSEEPLKLVGVAVSAEYLWVARSRQDVMPSHAEFGVLFVPRARVAEIADAALRSHELRSSDLSDGQVNSLRVASDPNMGSRLLYSLVPGADAETTLSRVEALLGEQNVLASTPREQLVGIELLQLDVDGFQEMAVAFPFFFLTVAGFIVTALLNRRVDQERPIIGTMLALGLHRRAVLAHYLSYGLAIGILGGAAGTAFGVLMGGEMTAAYAEELYIPLVSTRVDWIVVAIGAAAGLAVPLAAAILPAWRAADLEPAQAMQAFLPQHLAGIQLGGPWMLRLPLGLRLSLRDLGRHPLRSIGTAAGVASAIILIVTTAGMFDSIERGLDLAFDESQRYDLRADFIELRSSRQLESALGHLRGVEEVEVLLTLPVQVRNLQTGDTYNTILQGLPDPSPLLQVLDSGGTELTPHGDGAIVSRSIANELGVHVGDRVEVKLLPRGKKKVVTVEDLADALMGNSIVLTAEATESAFGMSGRATTALVTVNPATLSSVRSDLEDLSGVGQVTDLRMVRGQIGSLMGLAYLFLGLMFVFGVVLASTILFNTATISVLERQRELATMRALGTRMSRIARMVTVENGLIAVLGLATGLPLSLLGLWGFLQLFSSDLFSMPFWLHPRTVAAAVLGVTLVLLAAQWPALRHVGRLNVAESTKQRE